MARFNNKIVNAIKRQVGKNGCITMKMALQCEPSGLMPLDHIMMQVLTYLCLGVER